MVCVPVLGIKITNTWKKLRERAKEGSGQAAGEAEPLLQEEPSHAYGATKVLETRDLLVEPEM